MKKLMKKMKGKKVLSLVLAAIMLATTFSVAVPMLKLDASAQGETINGITQTRIVPDGTYQSTYASFAAGYVNGFGEPTELVIPGLTETNNYVVQGMTYYPEKNWVLVTAYHNSDSPSPSMVYCLDVATGDFVAMFSFINVDGTPNTDHGGGIAVSENNIYYSCGDMDRSIAYAPLSAIEGIENDVTKYRTVQLLDEVTFYEIGSVTDGDKTAYSAYCCYDQGVLWTGNFYDKGVANLVAADYNVKAHSDYPSMVWGYELSGDNSEEEWARLTKKYNKIKIATASNTITGTGATMTYNAVDNGSSIDITGNVTYDGSVATVGELTANFGYYYLNEGETYTIEYTATNDSSYANEVFLFAPNGTHTNIHEASACKRTDLGNGTYKYQLTFKAGTAPAGANSTWAADGSGSYTGKYTIRFDQNSISASRDFSITGLAITTGDSSKTAYEKVAAVTDDHQGQPTYVIALPSDIVDVQYATVDDGRLYLSRSYGTGTETCIKAGMEEYSKLSICDIDLTVPGTGTIKFVTDANQTENTVNDAYIISSMQTFDLMPMSEGLCVIDDYVYMTFESACYKYYKDSDLMGNCNHPVDVVWKIDQYGLIGHERPDETPISAYQKVNYVSEIDATEEYIVVFESDLEAEGNQNKTLYALDTYGGYKGDKLPKNDAGTKANTLDSMGMIGHKITDYHKYINGDGDEFIILDDAKIDDVPNIRWNLIGAGTNSMRIHSVDLYNATYSNLCFDSRLIYMSTDSNSNLDNIKLVNKEVDGTSVPGEFWIYNSSNNSYLWCNDGSDEAVMDAYNAYYKTGNTQTQKFTNEQEIAGTFHADAKKLAASADSGNQGSAMAAPYDLGTFNIYKRITVDPETMGGTGLETDLTAELQADGTYTINVGTYATSAAHKYLGESGYPTDFMFVLDASGSMTNNSDYVTYNNQGNLAISRAFANDSTGYYVYVDQVEKTDGSIVTVNQFCRLEGHTGALFTSDFNKYWVTADAQDGSEASYMLSTDGTFKWSKSQISTVSGSDTTITDKIPVYRKVTTTRLQGMKDAVNSFIEKIDKNAQTFNTEHRIAIATFGSDGNDENSTAFRNTGIYSTLNGTTINQYTESGIEQAQYAAAFYPSNHANLKTIVNSIDTSEEDPDTFSNYGFDMATNALAQQSPAFGGAGDKYYSDWTDPETGIVHKKNANAVVIFLTDGVPGKGGTDSATATTVANAAISSTVAIKANGGVVYALQVSNASMDGFDMSAYMNGVSSNYPSATELTALGTQASSEYYTKAATDGSVDVRVVLDGVFEHIENNYIDTGTAITLGSDSIVRQVLGDCFQLTSESNVRISESVVSDDVLGNIKFGEGVANTLTPEIDVENNTVEVTGFDFSSNYYEKSEKQGKRLNIVIENVLPVDTDENSMEVINQTYTAIYENFDNMEQNKKFKGYPNVEFSIPEYTYVLDYGLQLLDTDVNGTLKAVSEGLTKQDVDNYNRKSGSVEISDNSLNLVYSTTPATKTTDSRYVLIQRESGEYDWFEINVVPASNVYFEETEFEITNKGKVGWSTQTGGTSVTERNLHNEGDVDGYDAAYDNANTYSNGKTLYTTVDSTNKLSESAKVKFAGNGIDIISACGPTTGMQIIDIKNAETGEYVAAAVVDTYYADATFSQVPVFSWRGNYGEYIVETSAAYLSSSGALKKSSIKNNLIDTGLVMNSSDDLNTVEVEAMLDAAGVEGLDMEKLELVWFDDNSVLNGGSGVAPTKKGARAGETKSVTLNNYLDGFRIYNPLGSDSSDYAESEQGAVYYNVIDSLVDGTLSDGDLDFTSGTVAFVTGSLADGETLSFSNYESIGPKNELYLKGGASTGVAFNTPVAAGGRVMVSLRAVNGTATATINGQSFTINSATEMYYDITDLLNVTNNVANVSIINTGSGILAVNNIKLTNAVATSGLMPLSMDDLETVQYYASAEPVQATVENGVVTPVVEEEAPEEDKTTDNNDTTTDSGESEEFSIFSLIEMLIAFIEKILRGAFGSGNLF